MENLNETQNAPAGMEFTGRSVNYLNGTRRWTLFLSIIGFIGIGFMLIAAIFMLTASSLIPDMPFFGGAAATVFFLLFALLYFFPVYYLLKFSTLSKLAIDGNDSNLLEEAMRYLKMMFTFMGILVIILLSIYLLIIIIALFGAAFALR